MTLRSPIRVRFVCVCLVVATLFHTATHLVLTDYQRHVELSYLREKDARLEFEIKVCSAVTMQFRQEIAYEEREGSFLGIKIPAADPFAIRILEAQLEKRENHEDNLMNERRKNRQLMNELENHSCVIGALLERYQLVSPSGQR